MTYISRKSAARRLSSEKESCGAPYPGTVNSDPSRVTVNREHLIGWGQKITLRDDQSMMEVISTRRYEARPPPTSAHSAMLIDPDNSVALVKEEEWETRKKKEITTTRQIETRVKRQVVLEDGEVVVDSGPLVTTNTTEDVEQQEHTTQERRTTGDDPQEVDWPLGITEGAGGVVQKELNETVVRSREEIEERLETEDRQQLGDITDEAYQRAVRSNRGDLRLALAESSKQLVDTTGPRVVQHTTRSSKVVDTEKISEKKELKSDGLIVTEKKRTVEHEEIKDDEVPDEESVKDDSSETQKKSSQRFVKRRDEDVVDYVSGGERVAREMRYVAETTEGERIGDWSPSPIAMRTTRFHKHSAGSPADGIPSSRKDALTKKPLDLEEEDEARKFETSKWLESHFGSESRSSSVDTAESPLPTANTSYINVTMKSCTSPRDRDREREYQKNYENAGTSNRCQKSRESEYFQGISEWSERYPGKEKQTNHVRTVSPTIYTNGHAEVSKVHEETTRRRDVHHETIQERVRTPSPPVRRRVKEQQWSTKLEETIPPNDTPPGRVVSPVHVVQRTWEHRIRDHQNHRENPKKSLPRSRSTSPKTKTTPKGDTKKNETSQTGRPPKLSGHSKYKIGESFRKLVGKLRSASTERKNKRATCGSSSTSQLTQTDDNGPTYLQYNVIDRNIPLVSESDANGENKPPPERPPRSPRNSCLKKPTKTETRSSQEQWQRSGSSTPVHRYYLGEDPFGGSIYGREKGYKDAKRPGRSRGCSRIPPDSEYSASSSLGRFSKSTSRLTSEFERDEQFRSTQTLPRNLHGQHARQHTSRRQPREVSKHVTLSNQTPPSQASRYSSMINISIRNAVTAPKIPIHSNVQAPAKPERTYNKSFNVEAERNGQAEYATPKRLPYTSNSQLNRLDETPPLKSPGILASISRSNRDLIKDGRHEY